jgi:universal stress protein E
VRSVKKPAIRRILVYAPAHTRTLRDAKFLAAATGAKLTLIDVVEPLPLHVELWLPQSARMFEALEASVAQRLHASVSRLRSEGVSVESAILRGAPETSILDAVNQGKYDLLLVGAARRPDGRLGTRAMRLLRKCSCPVWIEGSRTLTGVRRVVAAVDAIPGDAYRAELNVKIVLLAGMLAKSCGMELHVLNAWEAYGEGLLRSRIGAKPEEIARYAAEIHQHHREEIHNVLRRARVHVPDTAVHLIKGNAVEVLPSMCRKLRAGVLVLGTVARSGLSAALIGNTTEAVAGSLTCSMLAVKPDDAA